jgi:hydroxymethylpyrimidine kinase/phosphomethylpyrimidine kinase
VKRVLTIAGSDSGGGAGIQADLKVMTVLGAHGMSALTALTAQNTLGVTAIQAVPPEFVTAQLEAVLTDIGADAAKTGMLPSPEIIRAVAAAVRRFDLSPLVVDPVMVATSGDRLISEEAVAVLTRELLPLAAVVTPNLPEAAALCGAPVRDLDGMKEAARRIHEQGTPAAGPTARAPGAVLIKGGHLSDRAVDLLFDGQTFHTYERPRIDTRSTHGTGCAFSAALATFLAQGLPLAEAVDRAKDFITRAIAGAAPLGGGHGPTNPYAWLERGRMTAGAGEARSAQARGAAAASDWRERQGVLAALVAAYERLRSAELGRLIPEVRTNLAYAAPDATDTADVAAFPGRITEIAGRLEALRPPAFGGSRHVARVVLAAMRHHPDLRAAMNIRHSDEILAACRAAGLVLATFDRAQEPADVKSREGGTLEWGTDAAMARFAREAGSPSRPPDAVADGGEVGKEPIIRVLGRDPHDVVDKVLRIAGATGR